MTSLTSIYIPSPQTFYRIYDVIDGAENMLSFGAAIPWVGNVFGNLKIIMGGGLIATGLLMATSATCLSVLPHIRKRDPTEKELQWRNNLRENSNHFIAHGMGNVVAGALERHVLLGSLLWVVRVAIRSVRAKKPISLYDWVLQKDLAKIMPHKHKEQDPLPLSTPKAASLREIVIERGPSATRIITEKSLSADSALDPTPDNASQEEIARQKEWLEQIRQQKEAIDFWREKHNALRVTLGTYRQ